MQNTPHVADLPLHLVVVDSGLPDLHILLADLPANTRVHYIHDHEDALSQIAYAANQYQGLEGLHVIGHGEPGRMLMGGQWIDTEAVESSPDHMANVSGALSDDAHIWLYGCHSAQGDFGQRWLDAWALATGAGVHGSDQTVGRAVDGVVNWVLNAASRQVAPVITNSSHIPVGVVGQTDWRHELSVNTPPTFVASDGKLILSIGSVNDIAHSVIQQGDGKLVLAGQSQNTDILSGDFSIIRLNADGSLDNIFGSGGKLLVNVGGSNDSAQSIIQQPDGKLVVAGWSYTDSGADFSIIRLNADGSLDNSFGGGGKLLVPVGIGADYAYSIVQQSDGKFLIAGQSYDTSYSESDFSIIRLNADGSLDNSFGSGGKLLVSVSSYADYGYSIVQQSDGKLVVSGISQNGVDKYVSIIRLNTGGSLDNSFGSGGKLTISDGIYVSSLGHDVLQQTDGKLVLTGYSWNGINFDFSLIRLNQNGSLDNTFGSGGKLLVPVGTGNDLGCSIIQQADGKLVVAGRSDTTYADFSLIRLNQNGSLDNTFGSDGKLLVPVGTGNDLGYSIIQQADGKLVVAGQSINATENDSDFSIIRLNADGSLDTTFSPPENTLAQSGAAAYTENAFPVVLAPAAQILDAELAASGSYAGSTLTLSRQGGSNPQDVFSNSGTLSVLNPGSFFAVDGITNGRVTTNSNGTLTLSFNSNATQSLVNGAMQKIAYSNTSDAPPSSVTINWTFNDGNTGAQGTGGAMSVTGTTTVNITVTNDTPYLAIPVLDQRIEVDQPFTYQLQDGAFIDPDLETLSYSVTMADGTGVPPWLTFNRATQTFSGTPSADDVGSFDIQIKATDSAGVSAYDYVNVTVYQNTAPTLAVSAIPPYIYESEYNDERAYSSNATTAISGRLLHPGDVDWLSFYLPSFFDSWQEATITFDTTSLTSGIWRVSLYTPDMQMLYSMPLGNTQFSYRFPAFNSGNYYLQVQSTNVYTYNSGEYFAYVGVPENYTYNDTAADDSFRTISGNLIGSDVDSETTLTYGIQGGVLSNDFMRLTGVYGQMAVNPTTGAFTFTPNNAAIQGLKTNASESYTFTVSDGEATTTLEQVIDFVGADDPTEISGTLQGAVQEDGVATATGALTLTDRDAGEGAFIAQSAVPGVYGAFSITTNGAWTYTLNNSAAPVQQLKAGQTVNDIFTITTAGGATQDITVRVAGANDAPVITSQSRNTTEDTQITGTVNATDADGDGLTYTAVTPPAHGTVVLNPNGSYTYTPAANYSGTDSFTYKVNDGTADSNTATVSITVTPVNDTPVLANALADRSVTLGSSLNFAFAGNTFTDVDSPSLTYTAKLANGAALPTWLSFNPTTRTFSGTPTAANLGTLTVQVTASDGALSVADTFDLVISERPNTSPTASNTSVSTKEDTPLTGTLPGATDAESDPVTYAKASDPAKGTVSVGASGAFTYTPAANANGADSFTYTVTDDRGASSTYTVSLTITPVNDAPVITPLAPLVFVDTARSDVFVLEQAGQIQAQDIDSASLSYRISGGTNVGAYSTVQGTYGSLQVHTGTGAYTFFANNAAIQALKSNASETFTLTVSDGALTAEAPMTVQIRGANDAPVLIAPLSDQTAYDAAAWSLTLSGAQFSDADTGDVLTYTATLANGAALPTWLSFDPATRMFSGTPSAADVGSLSIRVSASDGSLSASDVFSLVVNEYFEPVVDDSSVATYARSANQYTIRFDPVSKDLLVTDTDPQQYEVRKFTNAKRIEFADLTLNLAVSDLADTIAEPALNRIAELYVAFFNRVPDGDGMEFWLGQYRQGKTINDIADAFYNAGVYFSDLTGYRADMSNDDFIHIVYRNVLGRPEGADQEGLAFWRAELDSGRSAKGTLVSSILDAAHGSTFSDPTNPYHWVQKLLDNKLEVAKQVSVDWGVNYNSSEDSIAKGQAIAASITPDDTSMAISLVGVVVADMV